MFSRFLYHTATSKRLCFLSSVFLAFEFSGVGVVDAVWFVVCVLDWSGVLSGSGGPVGLLFDHGVENDEELSHAGGEDDLEGLASFLESCGEVFDDGVVSLRGECGHVECVSHASASAGDGSGSLKLSAVTIVGCESGEGGDLGAVEESEFGKIGDEDGGGDGSDAGHGLKSAGGLVPVVVAANEPENFLVDVIGLLDEEFDDGLQAAASEGGGGEFEAVGLHDAEFDELSPPLHQLLQFVELFGSEDMQPGPNELRDEGEGLGINAVGLGEPAESLGEVSRLLGVDGGDGEFRVTQEDDQLPFVTAGGFEDDAFDRFSSQSLDELLPSERRVLDGESLLGRKDADIQGALGDINADMSGECRRVGVIGVRCGRRHTRVLSLGGSLVHGGVPVLQMRTRTRDRVTVLAAVRADQRSPATIKLRHGLRPTKTLTICRRPRGGA